MTVPPPTSATPVPGVCQGHDARVGQRLAVDVEVAAAPLEHASRKIEGGGGAEDQVAAGKCYCAAARCGVVALIAYGAAAGQIKRRPRRHGESAAAAGPAGGVPQSARRDIDGPAVGEANPGKRGGAVLPLFISVPSLVNVPLQPALYVLASAWKSNVAPAWLSNCEPLANPNPPAAVTLIVPWLASVPPLVRFTPPGFDKVMTPALISV